MTKAQEHPVAARTSEVWVTPELQLAAREFQISWDSPRWEALAECELNTVAIKFKNSEDKKRFLGLLEDYVAAYKSHLSTGTILPEGGATDDAVVQMRIEFFLPEVFSEVVQDLVKTRLAAIPLKDEVHELAVLYLKAFVVPFVRADLVPDGEADISQVESLERALAGSQTKLMGFLQLLVLALPGKESHRVVLHAIDRFEIDGEEKVVKGAARRALLALVLMRSKSTFDVADFVRHYNGEKNPADPRHDFDNAFKALRKVLPHIASQATEGKRTINNLQIRAEVSDQKIQEHLKILY